MILMLYSLAVSGREHRMPPFSKIVQTRLDSTGHLSGVLENKKQLVALDYSHEGEIYEAAILTSN